MARKHPSQVVLDLDEVHRVRRVRVAKWYGKLPHEVDTMPEQDFLDTLNVMWADEQK